MKSFIFQPEETSVVRSPKLVRLIIRGGTMEHFSSGMKMIYTNAEKPAFVVFGHMDSDGKSADLRGVNYALDLESQVLVDKDAKEMKNIMKF